MITLKQVAQMFIDDTEGGDQSKDSTLDLRAVILKIRSYLVPLVKNDYFSKYGEGDKAPIGSIIASYELSLQTESGTNQKYLDIPDFFITLPHNRGLHRVYVKGNPFQSFTFMQDPGISGNLPHTKILGETFCYLEGRKVKMGPGFNMSSANKFILQLIVPAPDTISDTDPLPILSEHVDAILTMLKKDFAPYSQVPVDNLNNQNPNIR